MTSDAPPAKHGFHSPLRYPGGKGALAKFIKLVLAKNRLVGTHYVEVYAGGAGIAWPLLYEEYATHVHINDLSQALHAFWDSVLHHTDELCRKVRDLPVSIDEWHRQRSIQLNPERYGRLDLGFSTFFLNRTNRSGIISGGIVGGKNQTGKWKLDARFNKTDLIARIQRIARYSNRVTLYRLDAAEFIREILGRLPPKALVYLDPPYYGKGKDLYQNTYVHADHAEIASLALEHIRQPWIVSYDAAPEVLDLYRRCRSLTYKINYSAQARYPGSEVMFFSDGLVLPRVEDPIHM